MRRACGCLDAQRGLQRLREREQLRGAIRIPARAPPSLGQLVVRGPALSGPGSARGKPVAARWRRRVRAPGLRASARSPRVRVACKTGGCGARPGCGARGAGAQWRGAGPSLSRFVRAPSLVHRFGRQHAVPARRSRVEELGHAEGLDPESERDAAAAGPPVPSFKRGECVLSVGRNSASEPRFAYTQCSHYQRSLARLPRPRLENDF